MCYFVGCLMERVSRFGQLLQQALNSPGGDEVFFGLECVAEDIARGHGEFAYGLEVCAALPLQQYVFVILAH